MDIKVTVGLITSAFNTGLAQAKKSVDSFAKSTSSQVAGVGSQIAGAFALGSIIAGVKSLFDEFGRVADISETLAEPAELIQKIGRVAELSGGSLEGVTKGAIKANDAALAALSGNEKLAGSFKTLGINAGEFVNLSLDQKLIALAGAYDGANSSAENMAALIDILGKSGKDLIPTLKLGAEELQNQLDGMSAASAETVATLDEAGDSLQTFWGNLKVWGAEALNSIIDGAKTLGVALSVAVAYVSELPNGFKAAAKAADDVLKAAAEIKLEEEKQREEKNKRNREARVNVAKFEEAEKAKEAKKEADKAAKEKEKTDKKAEKDKERDRLKSAKEQERREKEQRNDEVKTAKTLLENFKDGADLIDKKRSQGFTVDSLAKIGGGIRGAQYGAANCGLNQKDEQHLRLLRKQIEEQEKQVSLLEQLNRDTTVSFDTSFSDSED